MGFKILFLNGPKNREAYTFNMKNLIIVIISILTSVSFSYGQDWNEIEKVTFNGFTNPNVEDTIKTGQNIDIDLMSNYLKSAKKCEAYFPKGASIYVTVEFNEDEKVVVQFIAGGYDIFHVIKSDNEFLKDWYQLDPKHKKEWNELFNKMIH